MNLPRQNTCDCRLYAACSCFCEDRTSPKSFTNTVHSSEGAQQWSGSCFQSRQTYSKGCHIVFFPKQFTVGVLTAIKCVRLSLGWCIRLLRPCLLSRPFIFLPASVAVSASSPFMSFIFLPASVAVSASSSLVSFHFLSFVSQHRLLCPPPPALSPFTSFHLSPSIGCCVRLLQPCLVSLPFICLPASVAVSASSGLVSFHVFSFDSQHRLLSPPLLALACCLRRVGGKWIV